MNSLKFHWRTAARPKALLLAALPVSLALFAACNSVPPHPRSPSPALAVDLSSEEEIGPFANWVDVRHTFGAIGNGSTDDTAALQAALDGLRAHNQTEGPVVLYLPAGRYRISRTLTLARKIGVSLIGAGAENTVIDWAGVAGGTMLRASGTLATRFSGIAWEGNDLAGIGVAQWWNYAQDGSVYQGSIQHADEIFRNLGIGIFGGRGGAQYGQGDSETTIRRVHFIRNSKAGVNVGSFNALNWWIWDSQFTDCARGVSNDFGVNDLGATNGAGNFMVYRSTFERSSYADISIGNTQWFALQHNYSRDSRRFIEAGQIGANPAPFIVQGNTVVDTTEPIAVDIGNEGPLILLDNRIRSRPTQRGPVVRLHGDGPAPDHPDRDALTVGNDFTRPDPILVNGGRLITLDDRIVAPASIDITAPLLPGAAQNLHRRVFEAPAHAGATQLQALIDAAAASGSDNAVVHIPAGDYHINRSLTVPPRTRLQIAGDSRASILWWESAAPDGAVLRLQGPSYATVRDLRIIGQQATAIELAGADQPGGRIHIEGVNLAAVRAAGLAQTRIDAQANTGLGSLTTEGCSAVVTVGTGGLGPVQASNGSRVFLADSWYEGDRSGLIGTSSSTLTYLGGVMAPYNHGVASGAALTTPAIATSDGQLSVIGLSMDLRDARNGIQSNGSQQSQTLFLGVVANRAGYFAAAGDQSGTAFLLGKIYRPNVGATDLPDFGRQDPASLLSRLALTRSLEWRTDPYVRTPGATDVHLLRVNTEDTAIGLNITP
jgi:hypothetical protein